MKEKLKSKLKKIKWQRFILEFLSVFTAVITAFALTNWSENRDNRKSEIKILTEIKNGINVDKNDFSRNMYGHNLSLRANNKFRGLLNGKSISQDSIETFYVALFRDYTPVINSTGYESLKQKGLETITNDSLRFQIISLYDYYYDVIEILDDVNEMQSFKNYFASINSLLHPYMEFDDSGNLLKINIPENLSETEKNEIFSYLWRLEKNRNFKLGRYQSIIKIMDKVQTNIENEIKNKTK